MNQSKPDLEAIKTLAIAIGVRKAARQLGLPESTVKSWSTRYRWFKPVQLPPYLRAASNASTSPSTAFSAVMADLSRQTKKNLATASAKASKRLASMDGKQLATLPAAKTAQAWAGTAGTVHDWTKESAGSGVVSPLTVYSQQTVIAVDSVTQPIPLPTEEQ